MAQSMVNFTTDTNPPSINIDQIIVTGSVGNRTTVVGWAGSDLNSGVAGYQCRMDSGNWSALSMNLTETFFRAVRRLPCRLPPGVRSRRQHGHGCLRVHHQRDRRDVRHHLPRLIPRIHDPKRHRHLGPVQTVRPGPYETKLDNGPWTSAAQNTSQQFSGLSEGWHTVYVRAVDVNDSVLTDSVPFVVDTVDPVLSIISPANGSATDQMLVTVNCAASDASSGLNSLQYQLDGGSWSAPTLSLSASFYLDEGQHHVVVAAGTTPVTWSTSP